jgi:hypothetical protein
LLGGNLHTADPPELCGLIRELGAKRIAVVPVRDEVLVEFWSEGDKFLMFCHLVKMAGSAGAEKALVMNPSG